MADSRRLVLNDLLCFAVNKFSREALKPLKSIINDFYTADDITLAKELLHAELESLSHDKWSKLPRRRKDSVNRVPGEIEDIMNMLAFLDESKATAHVRILRSGQDAVLQVD